MDTGATAGAILRSNLQGELLACQVLALGVTGLEGCRSALQIGLFVDLHTDRCVRTNERADTTLNAELLFPGRDVNGDVPLLDARSAGREGSVSRHRRQRQLVTEAIDDRAEGLLHGFAATGPLADLHLDSAVSSANGNFLDILEGSVNRLLVHVDNLLTRLAVGLDDRILDFGNRSLQRDNAGDLEESGLHDDVDAGTEAELLAEMNTVDDVELQLLVDDLLLHRFRQFTPDLVLVERRVEQEGRTLLSVAQHVVLLKEGEIVTRDEVSLAIGEQVGRLDHLLTETQVRSGHAAGLLGVVDKVGLNFVVGGVTDDLDRVLVGTDGTVRTEAVEHGSVAIEGNLVTRIEWQAGAHNIIFETDDEVVLRLVLQHIVEDRLTHARVELEGAEAVATADDARIAFEVGQAIGHAFADRSTHGLVNRLADGARLFGTVENGDLLDALRHRLAELLDRERQEQAEFEQTDLLALGGHVGNQLFHRLNTGTLHNDDALCFRMADVIDQVVLAAGQLGELIHSPLHDV